MASSTSASATVAPAAIHKYGQDKDVLFGKMLRIDVDVQGCWPTASANPFVEAATPEIFALGLQEALALELRQGDRRSMVR